MTIDPAVPLRAEPAPEGPPLGVIGAGTMATAILGGATTAGVLGPIGAADPDPEKRGAWDAGFERATDMLSWLVRTERVPGAGALMLSVKPQSLAEVAREIAPVLAQGPERCVISVLAGVTTGRLQDALGGNVRLVRVMPNTPARVGLGMSGLCPGASARESDLAFAVRLFEAVGRVVVLDETMLDPFTGIAGSGPAYVFYLAEALRKAAQSTGFAEADADTMARQTILGAAVLLSRSPEQSAESLRAAVSSKKGTTLAATNIFDEAGLGEIVKRAVHAARDRSVELGRGEAR